MSAEMLQRRNAVGPLLLNSIHLRRAEHQRNEEGIQLHKILGEHDSQLRDRHEQSDSYCRSPVDNSVKQVHKKLPVSQDVMNKELNEPVNARVNEKNLRVSLVRLAKEPKRKMKPTSAGNKRLKVSDMEDTLKAKAEDNAEYEKQISELLVTKSTSKQTAGELQTQRREDPQQEVAAKQSELSQEKNSQAETLERNKDLDGASFCTNKGNTKPQTRTKVISEENSKRNIKGKERTEGTPTRKATSQSISQDKTFTASSTSDVQYEVGTKNHVNTCAHCSKRFNHKWQLRKHIIIHSDERPFACEQCPARFRSKEHCKAHLRVHTGEKPFSCEQCQAQFSCKSNLKVHLQIHSGHKPFSCEQCQAKFNRKTNLNIHKRTHSGQKPFSCEECQAKFTKKSSLNAHLRIHSGHKPFSCEECQAKFITKSSLKVHLRIHSGLKPFSCEECQAKFITKSSLKVHLLIHSGQKPFSCEECPKKFAQKHHLKIHTQNHLRRNSNAT